MLIGWAAIEVVLRLRNMGGRTTFDWTFWLVIAAVAAGFNLGFRGAHVHSAAAGRQWRPGWSCWPRAWPCGPGRS